MVRAGSHPPEIPPGLVLSVCLLCLVLCAGLSSAGGIGYLADTRDSPVILGVLPHGFTVGIHTQF